VLLTDVQNIHSAWPVTATDIAV